MSAKRALLKEGTESRSRQNARLAENGGPGRLPLHVCTMRHAQQPPSADVAGQVVPTVWPYSILASGHSMTGRFHVTSKDSPHMSMTFCNQGFIWHCLVPQLLTNLTH